jgi:5-methylcytosine-specific restriction endonuclease McrA
VVAAVMDSRLERHRFYGSRAWLKLRALQLRRHPLCQRCKEEGRLTVATCVDHVVALAAGGEALDFENLASSCHRCHSLKTRNEEQLGKPRVVKGCDVDGRPLDPQRRQGWGKP